MYVYKTYNPSEPVRKVRYWATKESRQDYLRYLPYKRKLYILIATSTAL
jgi:hypothetical protein